MKILKKRIIFIFIFLFLFLILGFVGIKLNESINIPNVKKQEKIKYNILEKKETNERYRIQAFYPATKYDDLNYEIELVINQYIEDFKSQIINLDTEKIYDFNLTFECYQTKQFISFVFNITEDFGCLHPENYIYTINFNEKNCKILLLEDLIYKNENLLEFLSEYCYNDIINRDGIKNSNIENYVKSGTNAVMENFRLFSINDENITVYFNEYQVVPYYLGIQQVKIPLEKIKL